MKKKNFFGLLIFLVTISLFSLFSSCDDDGGGDDDDSSSSSTTTPTQTSPYFPPCKSS